MVATALLKPEMYLIPERTPKSDSTLTTALCRSTKETEKDLSLDIQRNSNTLELKVSSFGVSSTVYITILLLIYIIV